MRAYMEMGMRLYPHDSQILRSATTVFMQYEWPLPCWLSELHQEHDVGDFANILLCYDHLEVAFEILMKSVQSANEAVISERSRSILPYTQIDMFFRLVEKSGSSPLKELAKQLAERVRLYFDRVESFSRR
ncbi:unnamed protein product [Toxocara canis]|nr:unnamed protein product [Toxocara canis]